MDLSKIIVIQESQSNGCECRCLKHHRHMVMSGFCFAFEVEFYQKKKKKVKYSVQNIGVNNYLKWSLELGLIFSVSTVNKFYRIQELLKVSVIVA